MYPNKSRTLGPSFTSASLASSEFDSTGAQSLFENRLAENPLLLENTHRPLSLDTFSQLIYLPFSRLFWRSTRTRFCFLDATQLGMAVYHEASHLDMIRLYHTLKTSWETSAHLKIGTDPNLSVRLAAESVRQGGAK